MISKEGSFAYVAWASSNDFVLLLCGEDVIEIHDGLDGVIVRLYLHSIWSKEASMAHQQRSDGVTWDGNNLKLLDLLMPMGTNL